jgi:uncharacterized membrane protein YcjF (UPF0283 family)
MTNLWLRIKIWTKGIIFGLLLLYALAFVFKNQGYPATMWVAPYRAIDSTVLLVAFFAFMAGVVVAILVRTSLVTVRQVRELKERSRSIKLERTVQDMQNKAAMLRAKPGGTIETSAAPDEPTE